MIEKPDIFGNYLGFLISVHPEIVFFERHRPEKNRNCPCYNVLRALTHKWIVNLLQMTFFGRTRPATSGIILCSAGLLRGRQLGPGYGQ